jgi:hypothetical protein
VFGPLRQPVVTQPPAVRRYKHTIKLLQRLCLRPSAQPTKLRSTAPREHSRPNQYNPHEPFGHNEPVSIRRQSNPSSVRICHPGDKFFRRDRQSYKPVVAGAFLMKQLLVNTSKRASPAALRVITHIDEAGLMSTHRGCRAAIIVQSRNWDFPSPKT